MSVRHVLVASLVAPLIFASPDHIRRLSAQEQGQSPGASQPSTGTPVFRGAIEAIQVDVTVTDRAGHPIIDLQASDFEIFEDGVRQGLTTFARIEAPSAPSTVGFAGAESDVGTNAETPGRVYVIALDNLTATNGLRARQLMKTFIERHFGPNDLGAVVAIGQGLRSAGQDFTRSKVHLLTALDRFSGTAEAIEPPPGPTGDAWRKDAAINQLGSLADLVEFTLKLPHGRKALLLISETLRMDVRAVLESPSRAKTLKAFCSQTEINYAMSCEPSQFLHRALVAAARANLAIYPIDPTGLTGGGRNFNFVDLAGATGGLAVDNTNEFDAHFARIATHQGNYYLLGFNSAYQGRVGRSVPLRITVRRPGAIVNARTSYVSPFKEEKKLFEESSQKRLAAALASPVSSSGLPLQVTAAPFKGPDGNAAVALTIQVDASKISFVERRDRMSGRIELLTTLTQNGIQVGDSKRYDVKFDLLPSTRARLQESGLRLLVPVSVPTGRYQLRIAAGNDALAGSVLYDLDIPDFDSRFVMGGLLVASERSNVIVTVTPGNTGRIPGASVITPTTTRDFSPHDEIRIYTELYDERASPADFGGDAELRDVTGRVTVSKPLERVPGESGMLEGSRMQVNLPLAGVPPGTYALQVHSRSGDDKDRRGTRSLLIRVK